MKQVLKFVLLLFISATSFSAIAQESKEITLSDIWIAPRFNPKRGADITSMNDGKSFLILENGQINVYDYSTAKKTKTLVDEIDLKKPDGKGNLKIDSYEFSTDEKKILISTDEEPIYRRSSKSYYYIYNVVDKSLKMLSENGKQQLATFSPNADKVAFVRENNIFIKDLTSNEETQITSDGKFNFIINGAPDWVYEEEFEFAKGFEWNLDGTQLAYLKFNETNVKQYNMQKWGELYPEDYKYKYPKPGEANSVVTVHVYHLKDRKTVNVNLGNDVDYYIPRMKFAHSTNILSIIKMNRLQNKMEIYHSNSSNGQSVVVYSEDNKCYIDLSHFTLDYLADNKSFIITNEKDGWNHIYKYDYTSKESVILTKGSWDVADVVGVDNANSMVYYLSTEDSPLERYLYSININNFKKTKISERKGTHEIEFNSTYTCFIDKFSDANTPLYISIFNNKGKELCVLEDNKKVKDLMLEYKFINKEFFTFKTTEGIELTGSMMKPATLDPNKKYPVLMTFYGGPGSQEVSNSWGYYEYIWHQMLVQKGYIVVTVDGRGTGFRGEAFKKSTYLQMGKLETVDQIETAKYLGSLNYIDKSRIGVWGWSFGGYLSTLCMTKGADFFKAGIAIAPVTNWRFYDDIYTERFMRTPQENGAGYDENSPINHVKLLKGKYLLVHGTADDNVHIQNSFELIDALVKNNKQFDMQIYTNKNHSIYGGYTRYHLYNKVTNFILNNL
ncbi:MAG: DPP IV N-terminal domain-containing protein [Bacteroidota bacterium]